MIAITFLLELKALDNATESIPFAKQITIITSLSKTCTIFVKEFYPYFDEFRLPTIVNLFKPSFNNDRSPL